MNLVNMNRNFLHKITLFTALVLISLSISSCISGVGNKVSSQVQIGLKINGMTDTLSVGSDSLEVTEVQLVHGISFFISQQDTLLISRNPTPLRFNSTVANPQRLLASLFPEGTYNQFDLKIVQAPTGGSAANPQFYPGKKRLSMIVKGTYNGSDFTFQSEHNFSVPFPFNPAVNVSKYNDNFIFIISTDIKSWFLTQGGQSFYDPRDASNTQAINDNIEASLTFEQAQP